jgi:hypothetical protein
LKTINNEQILDTIYDLADMAGLRIDEFLFRIEEEFGEQPINLDGLPESVVNELTAARELKKESRKQNRLKRDEDEIALQIEKFKEIFPEVLPEEIPESVWTEVSNGIPLAHAFALHNVVQANLDRYANDVNERNAKVGAHAESDGSTEPVFTKEAVEKMSGNEIKNNYKNILRAMKGWRF